mmetsp:Transcript_9251/g.56324  ORF Transcript_9251/g.56324 Transcript_9251/m.56324 type:complete len:99 (+) Transcript_9251:77-373(+)
MLRCPQCTPDRGKFVSIFTLLLGRHVFLTKLTVPKIIKQHRIPMFLSTIHWEEDKHSLPSTIFQPKGSALSPNGNAIASSPLYLPFKPWSGGDHVALG